MRMPPNDSQFRCSVGGTTRDAIVTAPPTVPTIGQLVQAPLRNCKCNSSLCAPTANVNGQLSRSHGTRTRHDHAPQRLPSAPGIIPCNSKAIQLRVPQRLIRTDGEGKKIYFAWSPGDDLRRGSE